MVILEFSMYPLGKGESVGAYVARSVDIIDRSGLPYQLTAMGTILEGQWDEVMAVVNECYRAMRVDCERIVASVKIDYRVNTSGRLKGKVRSVESKVGRKVQC